MIRLHPHPHPHPHPHASVPLCTAALRRASHAANTPAPGCGHPAAWKENPVDAWTRSRAMAFAFVWGLVVVMTLLAYAVVEWAKPASRRGKYPSSCRDPGLAGTPQPLGVFAREFGCSLAFVSFLGVFARWVAEQTVVHKYGLTYEVWGLLFGMVFANVYAEGTMPPSMGRAAKGEDFIKVGLVLLGLDVQTVRTLALPPLHPALPVFFSSCF